MTALRHLLPCLVLALLWPGASLAIHAQPAPPPPAVFRVMSLVPADGLLVDLARRPAQVVAVSSSRFSAPFEVPPDGRVELYRLIPSTTPEIPPSRASALEAKLPSTPGAETLLLLLPREGAPDPALLNGPLRALLIDISLAAHPVGQIRVFNLCTRHAAVQLGNETRPLQPGQNAAIPFPRDTRPWFSTALVHEEGWKRITGAPLHLREGARALVFLVDLPPHEERKTPFGLSIFRAVDSPSPPTPPSR